MQDESDTGDKNIVEDVVQKWLVFIHFIQEKPEQGDEFRSHCKKNTMKGKLGKYSITSSLYKINKCKLSKVTQSKSCKNSRHRFCFFASKTVKWFISSEIC